MHLFEEIYIKANSDGKSLEELLGDAKNAYKYLLDDKRFRNKTGIPVRFDERGFDEFFYSVEAVMNDEIGRAATKQINRNKHSIDLLLSTVQHLEQIVKSMDFEFYERNKKLEKKPDIRGYEHFVCPIIINDKPRKIKLVFEKKFKDKDKTAHYYYHYIESKERPTIIIHSFELI